MWHSLESVRFTDFIMIWTNHFQQQQTFLISHPCFLMVGQKGDDNVGCHPSTTEPSNLTKKKAANVVPKTLDTRLHQTLVFHSLKKVWLLLFCGCRIITFKSFLSLVDSKISTLIHVVMQPFPFFGIINSSKKVFINYPPPHTCWHYSKSSK